METMRRMRGGMDEIERVGRFQCTERQTLVGAGKQTGGCNRVGGALRAAELPTPLFLQLALQVTTALHN